MELRLEVRTRVNVSRDQHEIQVISVRSAGVPFKVIQSPDASCYSGPAQQSQSQPLQKKAYGPVFIDFFSNLRSSNEIRQVSVKQTEDVSDECSIFMIWLGIMRRCPVKIIC